MAFGNHNLPGFKAWARAEYFYNCEEHHGEFERVLVFGATSIPGRALGFTMVTERGAEWCRLPISALVHKQDAPNPPVDHLQLWDCFSYDFGVIRYQFLGRCKVQLKDKQWYHGDYLFTFDWFDADRSRVETCFAEIPEEHKSAHFIALDNGCYVAQPNNRIIWLNPDFIPKPLEGNPGYKTNTHTWHCESGDPWTADDTDHKYYGLDVQRSA